MAETGNRPHRRNALTPMQPGPHDPEEFGDPLSEALAVTASEALTAKGKKIFHIIVSFLFGQGAVQGIGLLTGIFLVRRLSVEAYAQFGVATGFQSLFSVLMDLGFASTIIPMVGDRIEDRALIGRYVRAARHLRDRTFWILAPVTALTFLATIHKRHWSVGLQLALLASILLTLYSSGMMSFFSTPLFLKRRLNAYYIPQAVTGGVRLVLYGILSFTGALTAWTAAGLGALSVTANALVIRRQGSKYLDWPVRDDPNTDRELFRYILPATPAIVFSAFQGQISLFLISFFGSTLNIAEVSALGRIGQLFTVLMYFNTIIVEPYMARLQRRSLARHYVALLLTAVVAFVPVVAAAFRWPSIFIWIIGPRFTGLRDVMGWYILSSCINFLSSLLWIMNRARKWVFWSGSVLEIVLLLSMQVAFLALVGVRTTAEAVALGVFSSIGYLITHAYIATLGFMKGARSNSGSLPTTVA